MSGVVHLEGDWEFCFDPQDQGLLEGWFKSKPGPGAKSVPNLETVQLPHCWTLDKSPEGSGVSFYFKEFELPIEMEGQKSWIRFDSLDQMATVWLNGQEIGSHLGGHVSFDLEATPHLKPGKKNLLAIRIRALEAQDNLDEKTLQEMPLGGVYQRTPFTGILGGIRLYHFPKAGVRHVNCFPDYEADRVTVEAKLWNTKNHTIEVTFTLISPDGETGSVSKKAKVDHEHGSISVTLQMESGKVWNLHETHLYRVQAQVSDGYSFEVHFGIRRVGLERGIFHLNHQPLKVRGLIHPLLFTFSGGLPEGEYSARKELQAIKDAGFNLLRSGGAPYPEEILDLCDEIGLLVLQESTCYNQRSNKEELENLKQQLQLLVDRDGHHPCIFGWVIGSENGSMVLENGNKLLRYVSDLDPSRPIFSNLRSVHMDSQGAGKIDLCKVYDPGEGTINPFESHTLHVGLPVSLRTYNLLANYCSSKEAKKIYDGIHGSRSFWERYNYLKDDMAGKVMVEGLGLGVPENTKELLKEAKSHGRSVEVQHLKSLNDQLEKGLKERGIKIWSEADDFWKDASALTRLSLGKHVDALSINTQVSGFLYDNFADHGAVFSGLVDWFRRPKPVFDVAKKANRPIRVIAEAEDRTPYLGTSAAINIHMINEANLGDYGLLLRVKGPNGRIWHQESLPGKAKPGLNLVGKFKFPVGNEKGRFTFDLTLSKSNKEIVKAEEFFLVPPEVKLDDLLPKVEFHGRFPDSITASSAKGESSLIVATELTLQDEKKLKKLFERAKAGATMVLGFLHRDEVAFLDLHKLLPFHVPLMRSSASVYPSFHYMLDTPYFSDLPSGCLLDQLFADVQPIYSIQELAKGTIMAGSLSLPNPKRGEKDIRWGADICELPFGKGSLIFYQYNIFHKLGKNALADALFANLVQRHAK